ncbi:DUF2254 domain-containing protein [Phaeobacter porticola]|uniref:Putative membrane protein n=1 Tax=Phaeobacter porticola TaxID=1844006 RepID=A0A1L3I774_9RHOB|nr:DUF2254 domain-containing protein [Phaeobacter porticola]APG47965.1 putative membrane protein [Phaeobacter porticola]
MISRTLLYVQRITRQLWFRVVLLSACSLLALAIAPWLTPFIPEDLGERFGRQAALPVLTILASGMLAVTTFSLNVMVSAYRTAAGTATPRVYRLLLEDTITQSVLATFVGGFVFSLSAVILFRAGFYSEDAAIVVFAITVGVVALIVGAILRWIDHLSGLGSMDHTLRLIEERSRISLCQRAEAPCLGACLAEESHDLGDGTVPIPAQASGFVRFVDVAQLQTLAKEADTKIVITRTPGKFVLRGRPVAYAVNVDNDVCKAASDAIEIGDVRSFDQDPSFGLTLLAETAQRALSPGVNDPGTALEVMGRLERLLWENTPSDRDSPRADASFDRIFLPPVTASQLLNCAFPPIAQSGADDPSVMGWMDNALAALGQHPNPEMATAAQEMRNQLQASDG